jgi:AcrR family transcriptional regulator
MSGQLTRRERYRQQTAAEIKGLAMEQVAAGGAAGVSLNAIARSMAMSPGALYRYFGNRDELLAELVVDAYDSLADALEQAAAGGTPAARLAAVARAYRAWAVARPNTYRLIFESPAGSGDELAPDRVVPAAQRGMDVFLAVLGQFGPPADAGLPDGLEQQLRTWARRSPGPAWPAGTLYLALSWWSRLHGLVSLELGHHLHATGIDPGLLFQAEVQTLLRGLDAGALAAGQTESGYRE